MSLFNSDKRNFPVTASSPKGNKRYRPCGENTAWIALGLYLNTINPADGITPTMYQNLLNGKSVTFDVSKREKEEAQKVLLCIPNGTYRDGSEIDRAYLESDNSYATIGSNRNVNHFRYGTNGQQKQIYACIQRVWKDFYDADLLTDFDGAIAKIRAAEDEAKGNKANSTSTPQPTPSATNTSDPANAKVLAGGGIVSNAVRVNKHLDELNATIGVVAITEERDDVTAEFFRVMSAYYRRILGKDIMSLKEVRELFAKDYCNVKSQSDSSAAKPDDATKPKESKDPKDAKSGSEADKTPISQVYERAKGFGTAPSMDAGVQVPFDLIGEAIRFAEDKSNECTDVEIFRRLTRAVSVLKACIEEAKADGRDTTSAARLNYRLHKEANAYKLELGDDELFFNEGD